MSSQTDITQPSPTKQEVISSEGKVFESLTADSNYFDVIKLIGTPDAETSMPEINSPVPVILACYKQNICILFVNKDKPQEKDLKSNFKYIGTLKAQPPEILHSAKPEYLDTLEVVRTVVIKKLLENAQKDLKPQKAK